MSRAGTVTILVFNPALILRKHKKEKKDTKEENQGDPIGECYINN